MTSPIRPTLSLFYPTAAHFLVPFFFSVKSLTCGPRSSVSHAARTPLTADAAMWDPCVGCIFSASCGQKKESPATTGPGERNELRFLRAQLTTRVARAARTDLSPPNRRGVRNPHGRRAIKSRSQPFNPHRCSNRERNREERERKRVPPWGLPLRRPEYDLGVGPWVLGDLRPGAWVQSEEGLAPDSPLRGVNCSPE